MKKLIWIVLFFLFVGSKPCGVYGQVEIDKSPARIKKVELIYGDLVNPKEYTPLTFVAISETDSTMLVGSTNYRIAEIITTDSVTTYIAKDTPKKEFVYNPNESTLTQRNITRRDEIEVWFIYTLIIKNENEFEFGG